MPAFESDHAALAVWQVEFKCTVEVVWSLLIVVEHKMAASPVSLAAKSGGPCH
jgi:hypothetical protein